MVFYTHYFNPLRSSTPSTSWLALQVDVNLRRDRKFPSDKRRLRASREGRKFDYCKSSEAKTAGGCESFCFVERRVPRRGRSSAEGTQGKNMMNAFRFFGDMSHTASILILLLKLRASKSAAGEGRKVAVKRFSFCVPTDGRYYCGLRPFSLFCKPFCRQVRTESSVGRRGKAVAFRGATVLTALCFALFFRFTMEAMLVGSRKMADIGLVARSRFELRVFFCYYSSCFRNASLHV